MNRIQYYLGAWREPCAIQVPATAKEFKLNKLYWYQGPSITNVPNFRFDYGTACRRLFGSGASDCVVRHP